MKKSHEYYGYLYGLYWWDITEAKQIVSDGREPMMHQVDDLMGFITKESERR